MKRKSIVIINLIVAILVAVFALGYAFAWLGRDLKNKDFKFGGSSASSYFAGGSGTKEDPYTITNKYHVYNLAWLQDTGRFENTKYYFALDGDVTMDDMWVPPIGTDAEPFIGEFDGRGHKITGLKVTTNRDKLTSCPVVNNASFRFSRAVGFFGYTENKSSEDKSRIQNFILSNPLVEVAVNNAPYSATGNCVAGLAVGHVAGVVSSIGVLSTEVSGDAQGTELDIFVASDSLKYSTFNSILGELAKGATSTVTGGGHGSDGSGSAFGANFDISGLVDRLKLIHDNNGASWRLPKLGDYYLGTSNEGSKATTLASQEKIPFTVGRDSVYTGADAKETMASNNIGYVLGNQTKFYSKSYTFGEPMALSGNTYVHTDDVIPKWIYRRIGNYGANYSSASIEALTQSEMDALPQNIKDELFPTEEEGNTKKLDSISISQTYNNVGVQIYPGSTANGQWSPHGQISWNGNTYGEGFRGSVATVDNNGIPDAVDENGYRYSEDGNRLDENGFVFNSDGHFIPAETFTDVIYSVDENGYGKDENGVYYFKYKKVWNDADYIFGKLDANGYFYNEDGYVIKNFNSLIPAIDADGYALNADGIYYDASGYLIDENGFVYDANGKGYIPDLSNTWPFNGLSVDEDGYYLNTDGSRYTDDSGKEIRSYGYELATDDGGATYYLKINGAKATYNLWGEKDIPIKQGTKVKVITGTEMVKDMSGAYVIAAKGTAVAYHNFTKGVPLPNNGIWFKPTIAGTIRILLFAEDTGKGITLIQGHRPSATKENPFIVDYSVGGGDMTRKEVAKCDLPAYVLCYFEYEISQEEIDDGRYEYWIVKNDSGGGAGANFVYLDLGASAEDDVSTVNPDVDVSAVDFIYQDVSINQDPDLASGIKVGDFIVGTSLYEATKTSIYFEKLNNALKIVYVRLHGQSDETTMKVSAITTIGGMSDEVKATRERYALINQ